MKRRSSGRRLAPRRRRRWYLYPFILVTLFAALVWFAPTLIAVSPLKQHLIGWTARDFDGTVSIDSASLGWLSPVRVDGLVAEDANGVRLAEVSSLRTDKSLASLLLKRGDLGAIHLQRPHLRCELRADGSNVEDAIQNLLNAPKSQTAVGFELKIEDGIVEAAEVATGKQWVVDNLDLQLTIPSDGQNPATLQLKSQVTDQQGVRSNLEVEGRWQPAAEPGDGSLGKGDFAVRASALPMDLPAVGLKRVIPQLQLAGLLSSDVRFTWQGGQQDVRITHMQIEQFACSDPTWMGADRVFFPLIRVAGEATCSDAGWHLRDVAITSDVVNLSVSGAVGATGLGSQDWSRQILQTASQADLRADGTIDVARLAAMMPNTLRIRKDTQVSSGQLSLKLNTESGNDVRRWNVRLLADNLAGEHQNRRFSWDEPIEINLATSWNGAAITLDQLECIASFMRLTANGSLAEGSLSLEGDLARFRAEASQFIEIGELQLRGELRAKITWRSDQQGRIVLDGDGTADNFELVAKQGRPWREEKLAIHIGGAAHTNQDGVYLLDAGNLTLKSGRDQLALELLDPITIRSATNWGVHARVVGDVSNWMPRIQVMVPLEGWDLDGGLDLEATAQVSTQRVAFDVTRCEIQDLYCRGAGLSIAEPVMRLDAQGEWGRTGGPFRIQKGTLASTSLAMRVNDAALEVADTNLALNGESTYRVQLERVGSWFGNNTDGFLQRFSGEATGQIRMKYAGHVTNMVGTAKVKDFAYTSGSRRDARTAATLNQSQDAPLVWREPNLEMEVDGSYTATQDALQLSKMRVAGEALDILANGRVTELKNRCVVQLEGQLGYDLERLIEQFGRSFASRVQIEGQDNRPFSLSGPLFVAHAQTGPANGSIRPASVVRNSAPQVPTAMHLSELQGRASLSWQTAAFDGISLGPGTLDTKLSDGVVVISPIDFSVGEGRVRLVPRLLLNQDPMVLTLPSGTTAERVRLSPEICRRWLKYVAPLVADAAAAEGTFTVALNKTIVPIVEPSESRIQGTLAVHSARVGPGPLSRELLTIATKIKSIVDGRPFSAAAAPSNRWLEMPRQNISFYMAEQLVHHDGLQLVVDDVVIQTSGSVSLDQSLNLIAKVPIRDEWVARNRYLASLRGQVLQLPIQGTLKNPRVDGGALAQLGQQALGGAATRLLEQELNRGLQRLLAPRD